MIWWSLAVDHRGGKTRTDNPLGAREDGAKSSSRVVCVDLLRVVQERERPDLVVAQALVVEQHARDDERPCERPPPRLVGPGHEAAAEVPVEAQQLRPVRFFAGGMHE